MRGSNVSLLAICPFPQQVWRRVCTVAGLFIWAFFSQFEYFLNRSNIYGLVVMASGFDQQLSCIAFFSAKHLCKILPVACLCSALVCNI